MKATTKRHARVQARGGAGASVRDMRQAPSRPRVFKPWLAGAVAVGALLAAGLGYLAWSHYVSREVNYEGRLKASPAFKSYQVGIAAAAQGHTVQAEQALGKALDEDPSNALIYNALATLFINNREFQKALTTSENGVRQAPGSPDLHYTLGLARFQLGRHDEAAQALTRALELRRDFPNAAHWLGNTRLMQARYGGSGEGEFDPDRLDEAIEQFRRSIELDPDQAQYHAALGESLYYRRDLEEARVEYEKAIAIDPKAAAHHIALGKILDQLDDLAAAEAAFKRAVELDRLSDEAHYGLGLVYFKQERNGEATAAFREAIKINAFHADAHERLGQTLLRTGLKEEAERELVMAGQSRQRGQIMAQLREGAALDPTNTELIKKLGIELAKQGDYDEALAEFRRVLSINARDVDAQYQVGGIYFTTGNILKATEAFSAVDKLAPGYRWTNRYLAELYRRTGQQSKAAEREKLFEEQKAKGTLSPN